MIPNGGVLRSANGAGNGTLRLIDANSGNAVIVNGTGTAALGLGAIATTSGSAANDAILVNNANLKGCNNAGSSTRKLIRLNTSDQVEIAADGDDIRWGRANVALGGGAAPTLGTIGGSGPAAAAQRAWLRVIESDGVASFMPLWR